MMKLLSSRVSSSWFLVVILCAVSATALMANENAATGESLATWVVTVTITPERAIDQGAKWKLYTHDSSGAPWTLYTDGAGVDGWRESGTSVDFVTEPYGYKIEYKSVTNWESPEGVEVDLPSWPGSETGVYEGSGAGIQVFIEPPGAVSAGAQWRRVGTSTWFNSGSREDGLLSGTYTIEFKDVSVYQTPPNQSVSLNFGDLAVLTGGYSLQTGSLKVRIVPRDANLDGARWRRVGEKYWRQTGYEETGITAGTYTVEFKGLTGWIKPSNQTVKIKAGELTQTSATYTEDTDGSVRVVINPSDIKGDAKWGIGKNEGTTTPYVSGDVVTLEPGWYVVWFKPVSDKITPLLQEVQVNPDKESVLNITYSDLIVGKMKFYGNNITRNGISYEVNGHAGFGFVTSSSPPADGSPATTYTPKIFNVTGGMQVYPSTNNVNGSGQLKFKGDYGPWQVFIDAFALDVIYQGDFKMNADTLKSTDTTDSEAKSSFLGFDLRTLSFSFGRSPLSVTQECKLVFLPNIFPSETDEYIHIERMVSKSGKSFPEVKGRAYMKGVEVVEDFFEIKDAEFTFDSVKKNFSGTAGVIQPELGEFNADFKVADGKLKRITVDIGNISIPLPGIEADVLELSRLYFQLKDPSKDLMKIDMEIIFNILPIGNSWALAELIGEAKLDMQGYFAGIIDFNVLGYDTGTGTLQVFFKGGTQFLLGTGNANILFGLIKGFVYIYNQWEPTSDWDNWISATVGVDIPEDLQWLVGGKDRLSVGGAFLRVYKRGIEATINVLGLFDVGFSLPPFWDGPPPDVAPQPTYKTPGKKVRVDGAAPSSIETYTVPANCPSAIFGGCGDDAMPDFVLTDPAGNVYDPVEGFSNELENVTYMSHEGTRGCGFIVKNPSPGNWQLEVRNAGQTGGVDIRFIANNAQPGFVPNEIEEMGNGSYRFHYRAYDVDDDAEITFFWCPTNEAFGGTEIGKTIEKDGKGHFDWTPEDMGMLQGYVMARIEDGKSSPCNVYFENKLFIGADKPDRLKFGKVAVKRDQIITKAPVRGSNDAEHYKIYYNVDTKAKIPSDFITYPLRRQIKIGPDLLKNGRKYKLWIVAVDSRGVEGPMSRQRIVDFKTSKANNEPCITSTPKLEALVGEQYSYTVDAVDYDGDELTYSLESGPDGMTFDASTRTLSWTPDAGDIGPKFATVNVTDGKGGTDTQQIVMSVSSSGALSSSIAVSAQQVGVPGSSALLIKLYDPVAGTNSKVVDRLDAVIAHPLSGEKIRVELIETGANTRQFQAIIDLSDPAAPAPSWLTMPTRQETSFIKWRNANGKAKHSTLKISGK